MSATSNVTLTTQDGVAVVRIDTGRRLNAMTVAACRELEEILEELHHDRPRAAVFMGQDGCFSAGLALDDVTPMSVEEFRAFVELEYRCMRRIEELPFVTVAALSGPCIGNAAEMALACDYRIASASLRLGLPEVAVGFMAPTQRLLRYVTVHQARKLLLESRVLRAHEALSWGLVDEVVDGDDPTGKAMTQARRGAALAPLAVELTKRNLFYETAHGAHRDAQETDFAVRSFMSRDCEEGIEAFIQGREPDFVGR